MITALNEFFYELQVSSREMVVLDYRHNSFDTFSVSNPKWFKGTANPRNPRCPPFIKGGLGGISEIRFQIDFAFGKTGKQVPNVKLIALLKSLHRRESSIHKTH